MGPTPFGLSTPAVNDAVLTINEFPTSRAADDMVVLPLRIVSEATVGGM